MGTERTVLRHTVETGAILALGLLYVVLLSFETLARIVKRAAATAWSTCESRLPRRLRTTASTR